MCALNCSGLLPTGVEPSPAKCCNPPVPDEPKLIRCRLARRLGLGGNFYWGAWTLGPWDLHPLALLFVLSGTLMISKTLRIPKF